MSRLIDGKAIAAAVSARTAASAGQPTMIGADYVAPGAVVIDVGINPTDGGGLVGDVDTGSVQHEQHCGRGEQAVADDHQDGHAAPGRWRPDSARADGRTIAGYHAAAHAALRADVMYAGNPFGVMYVVAFFGLPVR